MTSRAWGSRASLESREARFCADAPVPETQRLKSAKRFSAHSSFPSDSTAKQSVKLCKQSALAWEIVLSIFAEALHM